MKVNKVVTKDGEVRWEVYGSLGGRGSKCIRRRFERKVDADSFITEHEQQQIENATKPRAIFTMAERTFEEESRFWLKHRGVTFSPGHMKRAKDALDKHILPQMGKLTLDKINPVVFSNFRVARLEDGLKPATVNRETEVMMAILNFAVKQRRIPYNPAAGFTKLEEVREDIQFWERSEAAAFLRFAELKYPASSAQRWIYVVYFLALNTALRAGEIWGLMSKDMAQGEELLHIQRQFDLVVRDFRPPKGKRSRYVPCNPFLRAELKQIIEQDRLGQKKTFFCTDVGSPIDHDNFVDRCFEKDIAEAGVKRIRFHDLRHTGTTLMIADGLDLKTVQDICGHQDITTTMQYVHMLGDSIKKASRSFAVIPEAPKPLLCAVSAQPNSPEFGWTSG